MIICTSCGRENEEGFNFCLGCGSALPAKEPEVLPQQTGCPHCGVAVPAGFKFCGACGGSLEAPPEPAVQEPTPAASVRAGAAPGGERLGELTVIRPDGTEGARIELTSQGVVLGRSSDVEVLAKDPYLSPRHAEIRVDGGALMLYDLDSLNGVFWRLRDDEEVEHGDFIRIGQELLRFESFEKVPSLVTSTDGETRLQGSPDRGAWGRLVLVGGPEVDTRAFTISSDEVTIGREVGAILFRGDGFVSGKHARIYRDNGKVFLRDLGSSNGSYIRIREARELSQGDLVLMGQQLFRVSVD